MSSTTSKTLFGQSLSDEIDPEKVITKTEAEQIFNFLKQCSLFRWHDANNDCEDRANAICILLDKWNVPNYKGWILSGFFIKKGDGCLNNGWKYHVAALVPVKEENNLVCYIIDPSTSATLVSIENWASQITDRASSYHFIKSGDYYIFPSQKIEKDNWHKRDKRNYRWTMQGLSGINGVSSIGKAQLIFNKRRIKFAEERFNKLKLKNPFY